MKILAEGGKGSNGKTNGSRVKRRASRGEALQAADKLPPSWDAVTHYTRRQPMFVLLNGSFGIGKSTVARELRSAIPGSAIFDPEPIGLILMPLALRRVSDFQHLPRWRRLTVLGARAVAAYRSTVIIPMAFSELAYLDAVRHGLSLTGRPVHHFCLTAPLEVVRQRLIGRGERADDPKSAWVHRRAAECVDAHRSHRFAVHIPTESQSSSAIAADIASRLSSPRS
jgi:predicted kinase